MLLKLLELSAAKRIAIIGAGGKTTLLWLLAREHAAHGRSVLVTTSTHICPPKAGQCDRVVAPESEKALCNALRLPGITAALYPAPHDRCTGLPESLFAAAARQTDFLLYEADGSREHPVKLYAPHEPVLYAPTDAVITVCGMSALGRPVREVCHRYERLPRFARQPDHLLTEEDLAELAEGSLQASRFPAEKCRILLNQADTVPPECTARIRDALQSNGYITLSAALGAP